MDGKDMPQDQKENFKQQIHDKVKLIGVHDLPNKFIAIYGDGSGASIIRRVSSFYFKFADDEDETLCTIEDIQDAGFVFFVALPDNFEIFGEK